MLTEQVDDLLAELEARSRREIEQVLADARAAAVRIEEDAARRRSARRDDVLHLVDAEAAGAKAEALADARRAALRDLLASQYDAVDKVLRVARAIVERRLDGDDAMPALANRLADLLGYFGPAKVRIRCRPALEQRVRTAVGSDERVTIDAAADASPGLVLADESGHIIVDDSMEAWIARERALTAIEVRREMEPAS